MVSNPKKILPIVGELEDSLDSNIQSGKMTNRDNLMIYRIVFSFLSLAFLIIIFNFYFVLYKEGSRIREEKFIQYMIEAGYEQKCDESTDFHPIWVKIGP